MLLQKVSLKLEHKEAVKDDEPSIYRQRFHSLVDPAVTPIGITDLKGRFSYVNQAFADLLGYTIEEVIGHPFKQFLHPADRGRITRLFLSIILLRRQPRSLEFRVVNKDKKVLNLWTRPTRVVMDGKTVGFQAVIVDITDFLIRFSRTCQITSGLLMKTITSNSLTLQLRKPTGIVLERNVTKS
jgi:PAS domain S-box-containing protein